MHIPYTDHLVGLVADAEAAATRLAGADPDRRAQAASSARREQAYLSARLDGSPLERATAAAVDERERSGLPPVDAAPVRGEDPRGSWARTLKLDALATQEVAAVEYANLLRCFDAEPALAPRFFEEPMAVLAALHGHIGAGLVAPEHVGTPRRSAQAVHDGSQGKVIYNAPDPSDVPGLLAGLVDWIGRGSAGVPTVVVAGVVHERILEWQPFEAGNGRVARAASRVVLRARGLDPHGVALPERQLSRDPVAYYAEVAATIRRRGDLRRWSERYAEAVVTALRTAAGAVDPTPAVAAPQHASAVAAALRPGEQLSVADYAARVGVSRDTARRELGSLAGAGSLELVPGAQGLRYRRPLA